MATRTKIEYHIENFDRIGITDIHQTMAKLGQDGWRICGMDFGHWRFYFQRDADPLADFEHVPRIEATIPEVPIKPIISAQLQGSYQPNRPSPPPQVKSPYVNGKARK